jgi:hypothetical protein
MKHDVSKPFKIAGRVDFVCHFASPASPVDYMKHPIATMLVGIGNLIMQTLILSLQCLLLYQNQHRDGSADYNKHP